MSRNTVFIKVHPLLLSMAVFPAGQNSQMVASIMALSPDPLKDAAEVLTSLTQGSRFVICEHPYRFLGKEKSYCAHLDCIDHVSR